MIHYSENIQAAGAAINMTIRNGADHALIMHSLLSVIRMAATSPEKRKHDGDSIAVVCDILDSILPDEGQLEDGTAAMGK